MTFANLLTPTLRRTPAEVDRLLLVAVLCNAIIALAVGQIHHGLTPAAWVSGVATAITLLTVWRWSGTLGSRLTVSAALSALVHAQLYITQGQAGIHLNAALVPAVLVIYRDWRPVALASLWFAIEPWFSAHEDDGVYWEVAFTVIQGVMLCRVAMALERFEREAMELEFLVNAMGRDGPIRLNLDVVRVETVAGKRLKHVQQRMLEAMRQVRDASHSVQRAAERVATSSAELRGRTDRTAAGLHESAMCLDQIGIIVRHSSEASAEAKTMSSTAANMANDGGQLVSAVVNTMHDIENSSSQIHSIVGVIDSIAFQTNILALNAAVEAARAGEQGRGFAVVAAEVRSLAQRSASAAREIKDLIASSSATVERGTTLVSGAGDTMNQLVNSVRRVGELFENINADADDHAEGLREVTRSVQELSGITRENSVVAEESNHIAQDLQVEAQRLSEVLAAFRLGGEGSAAAPKALAAEATLSQAAPASPAAPPPRASSASPRSTPPAPAPTAGAASAAPAPGQVEFF